MKRIATIACLVWFTLWSCAAIAIEPYAKSGTVTRVVDGDTLYFDGEKMRLAGIDAPESVFGGRWLKQPGADEAKQALAGLVYGKPCVAVVEGKGAYNRLLATIYTDKQNVNVAMVRQGHAWWYAVYAPSNGKLAEAQIEAMRAKRGVWKAEDALAPWQWRRKGKQ